MKNTILVLVGINIWVYSQPAISMYNRLQAKQVAQLESPDKSIVLNVFLSATGEIQYRIQKSGISVIEPSALGVMMKGHNFTQRMIGKDGNLYAYCMSVPPSGTSLVITSLGKNSTQTFQPVTSVDLLGYNGKISWRQDMDGLHIS